MKHLFCCQTGRWSLSLIKEKEKKSVLKTNNNKRRLDKGSVRPPG